MTFWRAETIKSAVGGAWLARQDASKRPLTEGVSTDSRAVKPGQVFIALRGEKHDAHAYLADVVKAGAAMLIIDRPETLATSGAAEAGVGVLHVPDSGAALLRLGGVYRKSLETTRVIAVGGSNGKTTTCRLVEQLLGGTLRGTASPKSFNNAIGVPLTVLGAKRSDQYLLCEVGTNAPGEIAPLADLVSPDIAVITSIGREHLEGLGSIEGVIKEEVTLLASLRAGGLAVINADTPALVEAARSILVKLPQRSIVTFGFSAGADIRITAVEVSDRGTRFTLNERESFFVPLIGRHNALNAAAAIAVARRMGVPSDVIEAALAKANGAPMRLERREVSGVVFVNDAYNANPESMIAAIRTFAEVGASGRRVLILGDMLELGGHAPELHREVGEVLAREGTPDLLVLVGNHAAGIGERAQRVMSSDRVVYVPDAGAASAGAIAAMLNAGDMVLLKGSRGMGLERIMEAMRTPPALRSAEKAETPAAG